MQLIPEKFTYIKTSTIPWLTQYEQSGSVHLQMGYSILSLVWHEWSGWWFGILAYTLSFYYMPINQWWLETYIQLENLPLHRGSTKTYNAQLYLKVTFVHHLCNISVLSTWQNVGILCENVQWANPLVLKLMALIEDLQCLPWEGGINRNSPI